MDLPLQWRRGIVLLLAVSLLALQSAPLQAAMVGNRILLTPGGALTDEQEVVRSVGREELAQQLSQLGVDPDQASARVARMSDAEVATLQGRLNELPAGAGVLELAVLIFIVFIITDLLGATDIFTFVKPINH